MSSSVSADTPVLHCRSCGEALNPTGTDTWSCSRGHSVPVIAEVVDCRPSLVGFDTEADRLLAEELAGLEGASFEQLLRYYWKSQPDVGPTLVERFVTGDLIGGQRAAAVADQVETMLGHRLGPDSRALEVGGGTGALGAELARRCGSVIITDISLAWLVLAVRRVREMSLDNVVVVAAVGDHLPIAPGSVDLIVAADVIEHVPSPQALVSSCYSALRPSGAIWLSTPNRLSLTPEPHVKLWGVGLLPRRLARRYVRSVRGIGYDDINTLSLRSLRRVLAATGGLWTISAPQITDPVRATYGPLGRRLIDAYHIARRMPVVRHLVLLTTPLFHGMVRRPGHG